MKKIFIFLLLASLSFASCVNLDIPAKNVVDDEALLSNEAGMDIYLARMYSYMPFEEFKYMAKWGFRMNSWLGSMGIEGTGESVNRDDITTSFRGEDDPYWEKAFWTIRDANFLIENLPQYRSSYTELTYNHYLGEAYFVRAMVFTAMAKRFGGIPLVTRVIAYPAPSATLEVPRSSEQATWDQILSDFNMASQMLLAESLKSGQANKYVALAYKSDAMLYAGSVALYNDDVSGRLTGLGQKTGERVIGFAEGQSKAASKRYFTEAFKAAREVMRDNKYSLYKKKWSATDSQAQYQNMVDMFSDLSSPENILVKEYVFPTMTHGYDAYSAPFIFSSPLSSGTCPTLDFVELFDGFPRYSDGSIKVTTGTTNSDGNYVMYDTPMDFFKNAEPRLRAYVIFPGDMFKGKEIEMRMGIYTGNSPVKPLFNNYSHSAAADLYQNLDAYKDNTLRLVSTSTSQESIDIGDGKKMTVAGSCGPFYSYPDAGMTGFYGRKWLNPNPSFEAGEGKSAQPFILMRYAEVMLNAAEAAVELAITGQSAIEGDNLLDVATKVVTDIRERAGADVLTSSISADKAGRNVVRRERRKELALEHKTKWDLRRWRVQHYEGRDGFWGETRNKNAFSTNAAYDFRGLYPFYSINDKKYFFDAHFQNIKRKSFSYSPIDYYFAIPGSEVSKSPVIDQQPNR